MGEGVGTVQSTNNSCLLREVHSQRVHSSVALEFVG